MTATEARILEFRMQGSASEPYEVRFTRAADASRASCTCEAGAHHQLCKHRTMLLAGDVTALVSGNAQQVAELLPMIAGSDAEAAIAHLATAENALEVAKHELSRHRKALARILNHRLPDGEPSP